MKKLLFLFLLVCCCACNEDKTVDGWVYASGRYGTPSVRLSDDEENHYVEIDAAVGVFSRLHLILVNPRQGATCTYTDAILDEGDLGDGEAYITRMDGTIISGTFSGGSIKEGEAVY